MSDNNLNTNINVSTTNTALLSVLQQQLKALNEEYARLKTNTSGFSSSNLEQTLRKEIEAVNAQITALGGLVRAKSDEIKAGEKLIEQNKDEVASSRMVSQAKLDDAAASKRANAETVASINQTLAAQERAAAQLISQNRDEVASATMVMRFQREQAAQATRLAAEQIAVQKAAKAEKEVGTSSSMIIRAQRGIDTRPQESVIGRGLNTVQILAAQKATQSMVESMEKVEDAAQKVEFPGRGLNTAEILRARNLTSGLEQDLKLLGTTAATGGSEAAAASVGRGTSLALHEMRHVVAGMDELARGQRGAFFSTLGAASRDAGLGVAGLATSVGVLVAVMGVMAVGHAAEKMAAMAQATRDGAAAAGMSTEDYSKLQGALELTGLKGDAADASLRQFAKSVGTALANPTSRAAKAFAALGISQDFLKNNDVHTIFLATADALSKAANSGSKTIIMTDLLGKNSNKMADLTQRGANGIKELEEKAKTLGITLDDKTSQSLIDVGQHIDELVKNVEGGAVKAFEAWAPAINDVIGLLQSLFSIISEVTSVVGKVASSVAKNVIDPAIANMTTVQHGEWVKKFGKKVFVNDPGTYGSGISPTQAAAPISGPKTILPNVAGPNQSTQVTKDIDQEIGKATLAAANSSKTPEAARINELKAEIQAINDAIKAQDKYGLSTAQTTELQNRAIQDQIELRNSSLSQTTQAESKAAKQNYAEFASGEKNKIISAGDSTNQVATVYSEWLNALKTTYKADLINYNTVLGDKLKAQKQFVEEAKRLQIQTISQSGSQTDSLINAQSSFTQLQNQASGKPKGDASLQQNETAGKEIMSEAVDKVQQLMQYTDSATNSVQTQNAAWQAIDQIIGDASSKVAQLMKNSGSGATVLQQSIQTVIQSFNSQMESFSSSLTKALLAPQQELIHAGLTTIHVNLQGQELKAAAQKLFLGMADDLVNSARKGLMNLAGQQLLKIPLVQNLAGKGAAASKGADFGASTANLTAFNAALKSATAALGQAIPAQTRNTVALHTAAPAQATSTATLHAHAAAATTSAGALAVHAPVTVADTSATATHTTGVLANAAAFLAHTVKIIADEIATAAETTAKLIEAAVSMFEGGGIVPSAAGGMVVGSPSRGGKGIRAILHAKEMVLPAHLSEGIQNMIQTTGGKSSSNSNSASLTYAPQINAGGKGGMSKAEFGQMLSSHAGTMVGEARNLIRQGWRP